MDWSIVTDRLAVGGAPDLEGVSGLMRHGFTHVIDLRHTTIDTDLYWMNFVYMRNPSIDDGGVKSVDWFTRSIAFTWGALLTPQAKVYVGCHSGIHRAPSTMYAILRTQGFSARDAESLIYEKRPDILLRYRDDAERAVKELGY